MWQCPVKISLVQ